MIRILTLAGLLLSTTVCPAAIIEFDFEGAGGNGLLPGNEVGTGANATNSVASGGEVGAGLFYDTDTMRLNLNFDFEGLGGATGLREQAGGGIHIHGPADFNGTASIAFFLNNGSQPDVVSVIAPDERSGSISGFVSLSTAQETTLLDDEFYVNIHSDLFGGGELRGNLVRVNAVPEPGSMFALVGIVGYACQRRWRRRSR